MDLTGTVATPGNDPNCQHAEIGERNKCTACGATMRINIYQPTKTITVINEDPEKPLLVKWMTSTSFKDTEITVDGEKIK